MRKPLLTVLALAVTAVSCKKEQDPFLIEKQNIGLLTDSTLVKDLKMAFPKDSIVKSTPEDAFLKTDSPITIFDTNNQELLALTPKKLNDSTSTIGTIKIMDSKFKTKKGLTINSTFADIQNNYKISNIQNTLRNVVVFVNDINAFFTIDKKELPAELQFDASAKIEAIQIPGQAKIKYFMIGW